MIKHFIEKKFLNYQHKEKYVSDLKQHFKSITSSAITEYEKNKNKVPAGEFKKMLDTLFPENSGYRCKERLFYRYRNEIPMAQFLKKCGIELNNKHN